MIRLIAAVDSRLGIAKNNRQPWKLPTDEKYFLDQTSKYDGVVLMGKTTYDVIGHPLKNRRNIVITHHPRQIAGAEMSDNLAAALQAAPDIWVIGGAAIFAQALPYADELYLTHIDADFDCDRFFPQIPNSFELASKSPVHHENALAFTFCIYRKA